MVPAPGRDDDLACQAAPQRVAAFRKVEQHPAGRDPLPGDSCSVNTPSMR